MVKAKGFRIVSTISGIIATCFMVYNFMSPDTTIKTAGYVAMGASNMVNRANTLVNVGYGEDLPSMLESSLTNDLQEEYIEHGSSFVDQCSYDFVKEGMGILNRKGGKFLTRLYGINEEFREEIVNFVRDKKELDLELILDKRCKTNTLNTLGNKNLAECITSKDNTKDLIEIMAKYYQRND